jgi:hypothetical protein
MPRQGRDRAVLILAGLLTAAVKLALVLSSPRQIFLESLLATHSALRSAGSLILAARPNYLRTRLALASPVPLRCPNPHSHLWHRSPAALVAYHLPTRFRALALFSRRLPERVVRSALPAAENLHINGHLIHPGVLSSFRASRSLSIEPGRP